MQGVFVEAEMRTLHPSGITQLVAISHTQNSDNMYLDRTLCILTLLEPERP